MKRIQESQTQPISKAAVAGLVLAILPVTALLGLIFSLTAFEHIDTHDLKGHRLAKIGTIISIIWMIVFLIVGFFLWRYFGGKL
ncbi:hypothetical protein Hs30E_17430 [Lactococcus hodotermopsidis]|uniref:DUF4190 domain-containing protein n=1 Tax=Pseudolactococcus hodotermopsidis TaxID=2709157 RepID=A0A6A0BCT0_9LACT|nr:DUF4190 domain-containing protein [Lactococcus hodotermopsidis]GFH43192.1 hypothetical protein Hs30E_17430 [Lactococcus hodotermopsidis]